MNETLLASPHKGSIECIESWHDGTEWYRIYSDGWCEQGGEIYYDGKSEFRTVTFHKPFISDPLCINITLKNNVYKGTGNVQHLNNAQIISSTNFTTWVDNNTPYKIWEAKGYIKE